ncbi:Com family DNA-binding transcriptional regulator [Roseibium sp. TrichSKD4]|uniref:Com family DNA-binding transcriptional regulator n=1 Tax=Roseibium sp. TrichSKD4 TaxID=744980 RepID=UPI0009FCEA7C
MQEIRCGRCRKLLMKSEPAAIRGTVEVKCPRCGTMNSLRPVEPITDRPERQVKGSRNGQECST